MTTYLRAKLEGLRKDERGQALVFGALTLFMLAAFVIFISDLGMVTSTRIQVQNAADECAYAGALYEANVASSVAYLNECMAYLYYDALRYAVDTTVTGVLYNLSRYGDYHRGPNPPLRLVYDDDEYDDPTRVAPGYSGDPGVNYQVALARARNPMYGIPQIERTLGMLSRWEWGMALSAAELVKMEINRTALKHQVEAIAIYPDVDFFPGNGAEFELFIEKLMRGGEHVGWLVYSRDPDFYVRAERLGFFHWLITNTNRDTFEIQRTQTDPHPAYHIQTPVHDITVDQYSDDHIGFDMTTRQDGSTTRTRIDAQRIEGLGWAVAARGDDFSVDYTPFRDGGYYIRVEDGKTGEVSQAGIRRDPESGRVQQWMGDEWRDVPGQRDSVNVGGTEVRVQISNTIDLPPRGSGNSFTPPNRLHLHPNLDYTIPNHFDMGDSWVHFQDDGARIGAALNILGRTLRFNVDETDPERMTLVGLLGRHYVIPDSADCKWHASRDGNERDRLCRECQLGGECNTPDDSETHWRYQYRRGRPRFIKENLDRFAHHALCDRDPAARDHYATDGLYFDWQRDWTEWYNIAQGWPEEGRYHQTREPWPGARPNDTDEEGNPVVRVRAEHWWALERDETREFDPYYKRVNPWDLEALGQAMAKFSPPLRLSEDFFYFALTVGCWKGASKAQSTPLALFRNPEWGVVGVASARAGFLERVSHNPRDRVPHYRFTWPTAEEVVDFVERGYENLYEPIWTAHLWPMTDAIRDDHLDVYVEHQTGLSYLIHGLLNTYWYEPRPPDKIGEEPRLREDVPHFLRRMHLNGDDPRMDEVIHH